MKSATGNDDWRHEWYAVEIDGKTRSRYGVYVEALKAGMELKQKARSVDGSIHFISVRINRLIALLTALAV
jgi:hypothetical protein